MSRLPILREIPELPQAIVDAGPSGGLVLFVGAGLSRLAGLPSWKGMAEKAFQDLQRHGWLNYSELEQLQVLDARTQLSIARLIAKENEYDLGFENYFAGVSSDEKWPRLFEQHSPIYKWAPGRSWKVQSSGCTEVSS